MEAKRAILRGFDAVTYTATVQSHGSLVSSERVPVSRAIAADQLQPGCTVAILQFWPNDPESGVVVAVW